MEHRVRQADAEGRTLEIEHRWVPLEQISSNLEQAVIVAEDHRFREHRGVDWNAVAEEVRYEGGRPVTWWNPDDLRALWAATLYYWENRHDIRGRSTISQQLARNLYLSPERSTLRKAREVLVARRLERYFSKDRILELYLNVAEWGPGIFGAEAAARTYFGKSAAELSLEEAAALAATLPHPLTSNPRDNPGRMAWRRELILERLQGPDEEPEPIPLPDPVPTPEPGPP